MDDKMYQDEFEQFLQDEVKQHRMYPSDHIWKNIRTELHGYKAWPALTFISLFVITALTISTLLNNHPDRHVLVPAVEHNNNRQVPANTENAALVSAKQSTANNYFETIAPGQVTAETFANLVENVPEEALVVRNTSNDFAAVPLRLATANNYRLAYAEKMSQTTIAENNPLNIQNTFVATPVTEDVVASTTATVETQATETPDQKKNESHVTADDYLRDFGFVTVTPAARRNSKFGFQFYVTPSTSYRRLSDEKVKEIIQPAAVASTNVTQNVPLSANLSANVNNIVRHKPAIGFELGFAVLYNISNRLKLKTGVQLNVRQYYIETFQSLTNDLTSLSLINYRGIETISFYSPYNNNTGYRKTQLDNKVYQLSVPIGLQWDMIQGKHFGFNTEASVQPTFTLNTNTYLLSTDYKHYTGGSDYMRKWNVNTSVGFNLSYRYGASSWQIGPQIRYQHLPTYTNLYPIKEYLVDYGIKLGYTRQIK